MIEIIDDESLKKENITILSSKVNFEKNYEKINALKELIEQEINKINNSYDKVYEEVSKSFEKKHEKLIKQENEIKEELQNKVTQIKEKLENFLTESNEVIRICDKINKGIKSMEKEKDNEKNMIKVLSYISKMNDNKDEANSLLVSLMKNIEMNFQEEQTNIKYEGYYFNGIQVPKNIKIKDIKFRSAKVTWDVDNININKKEINNLKYRIEIRKKIPGEKFTQIYEGSQKEFLINDLIKNTNYELRICSVYEDLISPFGDIQNFSPLNIMIDSNILAESRRKDEFIEKISDWCGYTKFELLYRGTRDGSSSSIFHEKCDNKGPTICLYKNDKNNIFGGFASISWQRDDGTCKAKDSFIFTLTNIFGIEPTKFTDKNSSKNVHHKPDYGPSFGEHQSDISIYDNFLNKDSSSAFPEQYNDTTGKGRSLFTGNADSSTNSIKILEIEVVKLGYI